MKINNNVVTHEIFYEYGNLERLWHTDSSMSRVMKIPNYVQPEY